MICANCFEGTYEANKIDWEVTINGKEVRFRDVECDKCPVCGDITFTHKQSIELDKKRISYEFGDKPILKPMQLKLLRKLLNYNLDEICETLKIGKNTYGRWERGEIEISPSMNLLIHNFMDKWPWLKENIIPSERDAIFDKAKNMYLTEPISFGTFVDKIVNTTKIRLDTICYIANFAEKDIERILSDSVNPEEVDPSVFARFATIFSWNIENLIDVLQYTLHTYYLKNSISTIHARSISYDNQGDLSMEISLNKVAKILMSEDKEIAPSVHISESYLDSLRSCVETEKICREQS